MATNKRKAAREKTLVRLGRNAKAMETEVSRLRGQLDATQQRLHAEQATTILTIRARTLDRERIRKMAAELTLLRDEACQNRVEINQARQELNQARQELDVLRAADSDAKSLRRRIHAANSRVAELQTLICRSTTERIDS